MNETIVKSGNSLCVQFGCGLVAPQEWLNLDASPSLRLSKIPVVGSILKKNTTIPDWPNNVVYGDILKGVSQVKPKTVDLFFASHVLEHLALDDFHLTLDNIFTMLKDDGEFRFIVPDLKQCVDLYLKHSQDPELQAEAATTFIKEMHIGCPGSRKNFSFRLKEALANSRHQWMWDVNTLIDVSLSHGFKSARECKFGDWRNPLFALVEEESKYDKAIGIELIK
jgi:Methyltransferase domain